MQAPVRVGFCLAHMHTGGIERNVSRLLLPLQELGIQPHLFLQHAEGDLLDLVPSSVPVVDLGGQGTFATSKTLVRVLRDDPVDVLCSATNAMNIAVLMAARRMNVPPKVVVGEHIPLGPFLETRNRAWFRKLLMHWLYPRADAFVAPSMPLVDEHKAMLGRRCPAGFVLPNPVVESTMTPATQPKTARNIVSLGRLSPEKDFGLAIRGFAKLAAADPAAKLTIFGEGPERTALLTLIESMGLSGSVSFPGVTQDVGGVLQEADLFVCSSKVEGFGNAIVEAQAAGVPVISVDCPFGPKILLEDGAAGRLVVGRDPDRFGAGLVAFAQDQSARQSAADRAFSVASAYTVDASARAHADLFLGI